MKFKSNVTGTYASKGLDRREYVLEKGGSADHLDGATLVVMLNDGSVEKVEQSKPKKAPITKAKATKSATKKRAAKKASTK